MITLRENQTEPINKAIQFFTEKKPKPSLIVLPTAWGKSILTAFVAKNSNDKMIVLQPSKELLEQNFCNIARYAGISP
nr:MAG: AAA domain protein [Bacteriophage sp.]